jgi:hypothetical protein
VDVFYQLCASDANVCVHPCLRANHSCAPNCDAQVDAATGLFGLVSNSAVPAGTPLSWDYCTTEW